MDHNLRNLKDFLTLYNKVTELCFSRCVDNLNERDLGDQEHACVDRCVTKFARFNQNMMQVYVEVQTAMNTRRMEEMEQNAKKIEQQQKEEHQKQQELGSVPVLTPITSTTPNLGM